MDNLSSGASTQVTDAIKDTGADVWPLPSYSPDFNPIEEMWSKVKRFLRGVDARAHEDLVESVGIALQTVNRSNIQHWFQHCGYRNTGT